MINHHFLSYQDNSGILVVAVEKDCFLISTKIHDYHGNHWDVGQDVSSEVENRTKHHLGAKSPNYPQVILLAIFAQTQVIWAKTSKLSNFKYLA